MLNKWFEDVLPKEEKKKKQKEEVKEEEGKDDQMRVDQPPPNELVIDPEKQAEITSSLKDYIDFNKKNPLALAHICNLFGVTADQFGELLNDDPTKYRDIPFATFLESGSDRRSLAKDVD